MSSWGGILERMNQTRMPTHWIHRIHFPRRHYWVHKDPNERQIGGERIRRSLSSKMEVRRIISTPEDDIPDFSEVMSAARRMKGVVARTPVIESLALNALLGRRIFVKAECLQKTGTFKFRGALNRTMSLSPEEKKRGVIAFSSGNFGQGLAAAASSMNVPCTIVMPEDAPKGKQDRARLYGATVRLSPVVPGVNREVTAAKMAEDISAQKNLVLLHPFEDRNVIAGQGTVALEMAQELRETFSLEEDPEFLLVPTGGGGLVSGCVLAMRRLMPTTKIIAVEPAGYDDHRISLERGERVALEATNSGSTMDALQASAPGIRSFAINKKGLEGVIVVNDKEAREAMKIAFETLSLVLEPSGACGLAAAIAMSTKKGDNERLSDGSIAIVASGGNVGSVERFAKLMGCKQY